LEPTPRDPDPAAVLADLDPELHRLPLGIPASVLGEREEHDERDTRLASGAMFSIRSEVEMQ
jgi:hypothetical protein